MTVEKRNLKNIFERGNLPGYSGLAEVENVSCVGKGTGFRHSMENPEFVPVHARLLLNIE